SCRSSPRSWLPKPAPPAASTAAADLPAFFFARFPAREAPAFSPEARTVPSIPTCDYFPRVVKGAGVAVLRGPAAPRARRRNVTSGKSIALGNAVSRTMVGSCIVKPGFLQKEGGNHVHTNSRTRVRFLAV